MQSADPNHLSNSPQWKYEGTPDEAEAHEEYLNSPLGSPGEIVKRLGRQFQLPRAEPDAYMSERNGTPYG